MMRRLMFLTTASAILAFSMGPLTARAAEGEGHGGEHGGSHVTKEEVHVGPNKEVHKEVHVEHHEGVWVPPKDIPHEGGVSIFGGQEHRPDGWRYRYDNGKSWW